MCWFVVCCQGIPPAALSKVSSQSLRDFVTLCINPSPSGRPSALDLLKQEFFDSLKLGKRVTAAGLIC
jgi:serine/threonine protein kinase